MNLKENNFAYIDGANLYKGVASLGWKLNYKRYCDADLVLQATRDAYENKFEGVVIIASDGDYAGLVKFLLEKHKFLAILSPNSEKRCSILLKRTGARIAYINDQRSILEAEKEKAPDGDGTP